MKSFIVFVHHCRCVRRRDGDGLVNHVERHRRDAHQLQKIPRWWRHEALS